MSPVAKGAPLIEKILVPVDGSEHANKAVAPASDVGGKYRARLTLLQVMKREGEGGYAAGRGGKATCSSAMVWLSSVTRA